MDAEHNKTAAKLAELIPSTGCIRVPNAMRRKREGQAYKMGYEVRLPARTMADLRDLRTLLRDAGFKPGKPYRKGRGFILPLYGRETVERFRALTR